MTAAVVRMAIVFAACVAIDAATKAVALEAGAYEIHYVAYSAAQIGAVIVASVLLGVAMARYDVEVGQVGAAMFAAGNLSNVVVVHGRVPDWIWAFERIWNGADVFIYGGVLLIGLGLVQLRGRRRRTANAAA